MQRAIYLSPRKNVVTMLFFVLLCPGCNKTSTIPFGLFLWFGKTFNSLHVVFAYFSLLKNVTYTIWKSVMMLSKQGDYCVRDGKQLSLTKFKKKALFYKILKFCFQTIMEYSVTIKLYPLIHENKKSQRIVKKMMAKIIVCN